MLLTTGGTRSVSEEDAGGAVIHIGNAAEQLAAHQQSAGPGHPGQHGRRGLHGVEEAGAAGAQVKSGTVLRQAQLLVEQARLGGGDPVRRDSGHQAQTDVLGADPRPLHGPPGGGYGQLGQGLPLGEAPLRDARCG